MQCGPSSLRRRGLLCQAGIHSSTSSLHAPLPLRKELHTSRMTLLCRMHGGAPIPAIPHAPSCSTSSPTASACPQMIYSPPVASAAPLYSGGRASEGLARSGRPGGVSTEHWGLPSVRQRRVGQLLGLSISSPPAERVSGRTASVDPILPTGPTAAAAPPWSDCKECAVVSLLAGRPRRYIWPPKKAIRACGSPSKTLLLHH